MLCIMTLMKHILIWSLSLFIGIVDMARAEDYQDQDLEQERDDQEQERDDLEQERNDQEEEQEDHEEGHQQNRRNIEADIYLIGFNAYNEWQKGFTSSTIRYDEQVTDNISFAIRLDLGEFFKPFDTEFNNEFKLEKFVSQGFLKINNLSIGGRKVPLRIGKQYIGVGQNISANFLMLHSITTLQGEPGVIGVQADISKLMPSLLSSVRVALFESGENNFFREGGFARQDWSISGGVAFVINTEEKLGKSNFTATQSYIHKQNTHLGLGPENRGTLGVRYRRKNLTSWIEWIGMNNNPQFAEGKIKNGLETGFFFLPSKQFFISSELTYIQDSSTGLATTLWYTPAKRIMLNAEMGLLRSSGVKGIEKFFALSFGIRLGKRGFVD